MKINLALFALALASLAGACTSPEATRTRGGGPGGDIRNRTRVVQMHEGSKPFYQTPQIIKSQHVPVASAAQADRLSRQ